MIQLNYFDWENVQGSSNVNSKYLYEVLEKQKVPVMIMEPLLGGRLANPNHKAQILMKQSDPDASYASWAFRFAGSLPNVVTILSGMMFKEHVQDSIHTFAPFIPINDSEKNMLKSVSVTMLDFKSIICTTCNYCMPCPYGIDIPGVFAHYNLCMNEGNFPDNPATLTYKQARKAFLISLDRNVATLRQANHCNDCGKCLDRCPQRIRIPQEMEKIDKFVEKLKTDEIKRG
jgi:predicted aldo/keto reductase-like oxidoreductase